MTRSIDHRIQMSRATLQNPWAHLNGEGQYDALTSASAGAAPLINPVDLLKGRRKGGKFSRREIETIARALQRSMWHKRIEIFGSDDVRPEHILDPNLALNLLGFDVALHESLGEHSAGRDSFEVAGVMDRDKNQVRISRRFAPAWRAFTAAHELGHVLLHEGSGLHRDRAPDGSAIGFREPQEAEADIFASYFLLPEKQIRAAFSSRFLCRRFEITDATAFALTSESRKQLERKCRIGRDLARILATAQHYNGRHFQALVERFGVSVEVMAIRLEELALV